MSQSSVAVSADGERWLILNASPDIREQLRRTPQLFPTELRGSPIHGVVLTNADVDHVAGLLTLREKTAFRLFACGDVMDVVEANAVFNVLDRALVTRDRLALDITVELLPGLAVTPFSVPGKVALYLEGDVVKTEEIGEQTVGLLLDDGTKTVGYVPGCAAVPDWLTAKLAETDLLLFDGTVWENDDMAKTGTGEKTGARMGHIAMTGATGSLARFADYRGRKVFIHINNTNPALQPDSAARREIVHAGWELAADGMEISI